MSYGTLAWHFIETRGKLRDGSAAQERGSEVSPVAPDICYAGLHASVRAMDALYHAPGCVIRRVRVYGDLQTQYDKVCGSHREVLWTADATSALRLFAADCAESVFEFIEDEEAKLAAAWAIDAARRFARGEADEEELAAARAAASDDSWNAARYAAWGATRAAAYEAARDAAWYATNVAAEYAARAAAYDKQNKLLTKYLMGLRTWTR